MGYTREDFDSCYSMDKRVSEFKSYRKEDRFYQWYNPLTESHIDVPVYKVPLNFPAYRLSNKRTWQHQQSYIVQKKKADDFFADNESKEAQWVQHNILTNMVSGNGSEEVEKIGTGDKDDVIAQQLSEVGQTEPIMMTGCWSVPHLAGLILNGNRRLSYFRSKTVPPNEISVFVLPSSIDNEEQHIQIERYLQMRPEGKANYNWINEWQDLSELKDSMENEAWEEYITKHYPGTDLKDAEEKVIGFTEVKNYLTHINQPNNYSLIDGTLGIQYRREQLFKTLAKKMKSQNRHLTPAQKDEMRHLSYILMTKEFSIVGTSINTVWNQAYTNLRKSEEKFYNLNTFKNINEDSTSINKEEDEDEFDVGAIQGGSENNLVENWSKKILKHSQNNEVDLINTTINDFISENRTLNENENEVHNRAAIKTRFNDANSKLEKILDDFKSHNSRNANFDVNKKELTKLHKKSVNFLEKILKEIEKIS